MEHKVSYVTFFILNIVQELKYVKKRWAYVEAECDIVKE
jgi:hypothetical protein